MSNNDFGFDFDVEEAVQSTGSGGGGDVSWDELNAHVIERAKTANKQRSLKGIISGIIDLGVQQQEDFTEDYKGTEEQDKRIANGSAFLTEENGKQIFNSPQKPTMQVAVTVDFPTIKVNKEQFFKDKDGNPKEGKEMPLRLLLNGEFFTKANGRVVGRGYSVRERKYDDGTWAFAKNNMLHKLADACGILDDKGYFHKEALGQLIGKAAQFEMRVWMKPSKKDASKEYFTEEIKLAGMIPEDDEGNIVIPKFDSSILYMVNFNKENNPDWVKHLRASVKNTIKLATNYEGSKIKEQLEGNSNSSGAQSASKPQEASKPAPKEEVKVAPQTQHNEPPMDFDDDIPF